MLLKTIVDYKKYFWVVVVPLLKLVTTVDYKDIGFSLNNFFWGILDDIDCIFVSCFDDWLFECSDVFMERLIERAEKDYILFLGVVGYWGQKWCDLVE